MKLNFIIVILLFSTSNYAVSQIEGIPVDSIPESNAVMEQIATTTMENVKTSRNPAMDLIDKNGGIVFAEVTLNSNLVHVFKGKSNNLEFENAVKNVKEFSFVKLFEHVNNDEYQVEFIYGVTDQEQRLFYEKLGFSGFTIKTK